MTVWDRKSIPPSAWKVEDGDWVPVPERDLGCCSHCGMVFESRLFPKPLFCSPGCSLKSAEMRAGFQELT
jgi:hypothetical protein